MKEEIITKIENASAEIKSYAQRLSDINDQIAHISSELNEDDKNEIGVFLAELELHIRKLSDFSLSLEEAEQNYINFFRKKDETDIPFNKDTQQPQFGVSDFSNLNDHEHLIPIH